MQHHPGTGTCSRLGARHSRRAAGTLWCRSPAGLSGKTPTLLPAHRVRRRRHGT